jgi:hypothetical protein
VVICPECAVITGLGASLRIRCLAPRAIVLILLAPTLAVGGVSLIWTLRIDDAVVPTVLLFTTCLGAALSAGVSVTLGASGLAWKHRRLLLALAPLAILSACVMPLLVLIVLRAIAP